MDQQELKKQQKIWYKKLKKSGFKDIEYFWDSLDQEPTLKNDSVVSAYQAHFKGKPRGVEAFHHSLESKRDYYTAARQFLWHYDWAADPEGKVNHKIWELHSEDTPWRQIAKTIKKSKGFVQSRIEKFRKLLIESLKESSHE